MRFGYGQCDFYLFGGRGRDPDGKRSARSLGKERGGGTSECNDAVVVGGDGEIERSLAAVNIPAVRLTPAGESKTHVHAFIFFRIVVVGRRKGDGDLARAAGDVDDVGAGSQERSAARTTRCNRLPDADSVGGSGTREKQFNGRGIGRSMNDGDLDIKFPAFLEHGGVRQRQRGGGIYEGFLQTEEIVVGGDGDGVPGVFVHDPAGRKSVVGLRVGFVQNEMNLLGEFGSGVFGNIDGEFDVKTGRARRCRRNRRKGDGGIGRTAGNKRLRSVQDVGFVVQRAFELDFEVNAFGRHIANDREEHVVRSALLQNARARECETDAVRPGHSRVKDSDDTAGGGSGQVPSARQRGFPECQSEDFAGRVLVAVGGNAERRGALPARNGERTVRVIPTCREDARDFIIARIGCGLSCNRGLGQC